MFQFEEAAKEVADELTKPRPEGEEEVQDIQVMLNSNRNPSALRDLKVGAVLLQHSNWSIPSEFYRVLCSQFLECDALIADMQHASFCGV